MGQCISTEKETSNADNIEITQNVVHREEINQNEVNDFIQYLDRHLKTTLISQVFEYCCGLLFKHDVRWDDSLFLTEDIKTLYDFIQLTEKMTKTQYLSRNLCDDEYIQDGLLTTGGLYRISQNYPRILKMKYDAHYMSCMQKYGNYIAQKCVATENNTNYYRYNENFASVSIRQSTMSTFIQTVQYDTMRSFPRSHSQIRINFCKLYKQTLFADLEMNLMTDIYEKIKCEVCHCIELLAQCKTLPNLKQILESSIEQTRKILDEDDFDMNKGINYVDIKNKCNEYKQKINTMESVLDEINNKYSFNQSIHVDTIEGLLQNVLKNVKMTYFIILALHHTSTNIKCDEDMIVVDLQ